MLYAVFEVSLGLFTSTLAHFIAFVVISSLAVLLLVILASRFLKHDSEALFGTSSIARLFNQWQWLLWLVVMTDVFLISNHLLLRGLAVGIWDVNGAYYPYQVLVADHARAGLFLHWDPWSNGGLPSGGDPQFGAFSPINLLIGLIAGGTSTGFLVYWLLMWWLGGVGMMLLARHLKAPAWGAAVVALGFLFCGTYIGHAEHTSLVCAFSFLPLVVWRVDVALSSRRMLPAIEAGALFGASALAGYPGTVIIGGLFVGLWGLGRWLIGDSVETDSPSPSSRGEQTGRRRVPLRFVAAAIALVPLVGVLVLAPTYFAYFYEGVGTSPRVGGVTRATALTSNPLAVGAISTLSSPYLPILKVYSQTEPGKGLWRITDVSGCGLYTGVIISAFALLALLAKPRDKWRWWLLGIGLLNLGFAVGPALPLRGWLYDWFYPSRFFRHPVIFRSFFSFSIAILALIGMRDLAAGLSRATDRIGRRFFAVSVLCAIAALAIFRFYMFSPAIERLAREGEPYAWWHAAIAWAGICVVAAVAWFAPPPARNWVVPLLLLVLSTTDAFMTSSISTGIMADASPAAITRWATLDKQHSSSLDLTPLGLRREEMALYRDDNYALDISNDQMITKVPAFNTYATSMNKFHLVMANDSKMSRMAVGPDRIWFSTEAGRMPPSNPNFAVFHNRVKALGTFPLLVHSQTEMSTGAPTDGTGPEANQQEIERLPAIQAVAVNVIRYVPDELTFDVQCASDGWLLVTDRWARSWRAEVNAVPVEVLGGNFIFRALKVSAGQNRISFKYQLWGFPWLVILSWGTLSLVAFASINRAVMNRRTTS
ncbi:MAG: hypothetical protein ABI882_10430 [Acidobacteriota bacterium]